jgi:signal transduction histidine kinase
MDARWWMLIDPESQGASAGAGAGTDERAGAEFRWRLPARSLALAAVFLCLYLALTALAPFPNARFGLQPWNPGLGLALGMLVALGPRWLPLVALAFLVHPGGAQSLRVLALDATTPWALGQVLAMTALAAAAAGVLRRLAGATDAGTPAGQEVSALHQVVLASACLAVGTALVEAMVQAFGAGRPPAELQLIALRRFVADLLGVLICLPALLWLRPTRAHLPVGGDQHRLRDSVVFTVVSALLLALVFGWQPLDEFRMSYLLFLPAMAFALRHGLRGTALALPLLQLGLLAALALVGMRPGKVFEFQLLMLTLALAALYLGALSDEARRASAVIAERERALRERSLALAEAQRIASTAELAAALAHDLSQPLSAIGTYTDASRLMLRAAAAPADHDPRLPGTLERIGQECERAAQYVRRMREFFRTGVMRDERIDVAALLEATHEQFAERLLRGRMAWHCEIAHDAVALRGDAVQVGAVLGNLVGNACDALESHAGERRISLRATRPTAAPVLRIRVEDSGPGLDPRVREKLFTPLSTGKAHGMGLGLALSRSIAERLGGRLWFDEQHGSTAFCLDLPAAE